ncbi:hypothetical protein [Cerasicoccus maritimus]|uniref:hypothetical protein n=1 Tax=Cerasicoccus maritimus TaxID=490089 RepID=UPI0028526C13|nr:hypothetical protein [Cerasicoccus maritimus]
MQKNSKPKILLITSEQQHEADYKLTIYRNLDEGELFDLKTAIGDYINRFNDPEYANIKATFLHRFIQAEMAKEVSPMARISAA